jgi:phosphoribosylglycinamide formyltransferase-1
LSIASANKISFAIALTAVVLRMTQLAIFASGAGTNAKNIIHHFRDHPVNCVSLVVCNNPNAGVLTIAREEGIPELLIEKEAFFHGTAYVPELRERNIDYIILAGFLWKIPEALIKAYPRRIINIHPALLPKHGGKGMYGRFVHEAVIAASDKETGITIHYVDEQYDHGEPIFQARVPVEPGDDPGTLARKVQRLEHQHFPQVIEEAVNLQNQR